MADLFYTVPLRLLGYGIAFGEAAKYNFPENVVVSANSICLVYAMTHVLVAAITQYSVVAIVQTLMFQLAASIVIPGVINRVICEIAYDFFHDVELIPPKVREWIPFSIGVLLIPIYLKHLDPLVMDITLNNIIPLIV